MFIAKYLGPYYFGLWGFYLLVIQYFTYSNFGIQYSTNVELSIIDKTSSINSKKIGELIFNSLSISLFLSLIYFSIGLIFYYYYPFLFNEYKLHDVVLLLFIYGGINNINIVFVNIYRSFQYFTEIALSEFLFALIPFLTIFLFKERELINALLYSMVIVKAFNFFIFIVRFRFPISLTINFRMIGSLIFIGVGLLLYNLSYNLFFLIIKSFVSVYYSVEQMGLFSFAFTIASATMLGVSAILFTVYPKILFSLGSNNDSTSTIALIRKYTLTYNTAVRIVVFSVITLSFLITIFFSAYHDVLFLLILILFAQIIFTSATMYGAYVFAQKKHWNLLKYNVILVGFFAFMAFSISRLQLPLYSFGLLTIIYASFFSTIQHAYTMNLLQKKTHLSSILRNIFDFHLLIPLLIMFSGKAFELPFLYSVSGIVYFILSFNRINKVYHLMKDFIK